jgi:hypothetical protein
VTLGLNWFWNPNMKLQWNSIIERRDVPPGLTLANGAPIIDATVHGFGMRMGIDF